MTYLIASYDPWAVAASLLIASFASYVALDLAKRVRTQDRGVALSWWVGGSIAMGTGIWCMHLVGASIRVCRCGHSVPHQVTSARFLRQMTA